MRPSINLSVVLGLGVLLLAPALWAASAGAAPAPAVPKAAPAAALPADGLEFFEKRIRPLLAQKCYACHSAEAKNVGGGLLLDTKAGLLKGGQHGAGLVPGKPDASLLIRSVRYTDKKLQMPPGKKLEAREIADLETWVRMGAPDPRDGAPAPVRTGYDWKKEKQFWSYQPLKQAKVPAVKDKAWPGGDIDRFVLAKLEQKGLKPVKDADRRTLIRRVTFDLTGLPPTPAEVRAFLADKSPNAWEKVVDRLLASPAYGEKWGRQWLDLVRYADTSGCNSDFPIPNAYRYRNYIISSFNKDKPYDRFVQEQIAGDLMPAQTEAQKYEQIVATTYLALARRFGSQANEFHLTLEDTIDNLGKTVLGLSVSCARCHDHKYDPVPQNDYYALYGIFQSTAYAFPGTEVVPDEKDLVILASGATAEAAKKYDEELGSFGRRIFDMRQATNRQRVALDAAEKAAATDPNNAEKAAELARAKKELEDTQAEIRRLTQRQRELLDNPVDAPRAFAVSEGKPANARVHLKGNPRTTGDEVPRGFLQILGGQKLPPAEKGSGRLELARWLTDPQNPLTARVMVNRLWQGHFGKGIVATPSDFGARGQKPTHPELLDYLARKFINSGWSMKAMHREMLLSRTYRLASSGDPKNVQADVNNSLLWRYNRHRLTAEEIRDAMLAVSGTLDPTMGEGHPFPPRRTWKYTQHRPFYGVYETNRRSVYLMQQRIRKHPFLAIFDGADPNANTAERQVSTTALQALWMMNDSFVHTQAKHLAERVSKIASDTPRRINEAYLLAFGRSAAPQELKLAQEFLAQSRGELKACDAPGDQDAAALASLMRVLLSSNEFIFVD